MSAICDAHKKKVDVEQLYNLGENRKAVTWRQDAVEKASTQQSGPPGPRLSSPGERERNAVIANRVGVNMLQFCSVSNSLSHTTLSIKWEGYFSKELCRSSLWCRCYDSAYRCACVCIWSCNNRTWRWQWNQLQLAHSVQSPRD